MSSAAAVANDADRHSVEGGAEAAAIKLAARDEVTTPSIGVGAPGRALIGWMTEQEATLTLASRRHDQVDNDGFREQARTAREAVAARQAGVEQDGLVERPPEVLDQHIVHLGQQPPSAPYVDEGWRVMNVDLSRVCALQPTVRTERAKDRVAAIDPDDVLSIAALTLPIGCR